MSTSHLTNPLGYRSGKAFLWTNNSLLSHNKTLTGEINRAEGLEYTANYLLMKKNFMVVKSLSKLDLNSGLINLNILYYPMFAPLLRKKKQPTYLTKRFLLNKIFNVEAKQSCRFLRASWKSLHMFATRRKSPKRFKYLKLWMLKSKLLQARFRGTGIKRYSINSMFLNKEIYSKDDRHTEQLNFQLLKSFRRKIVWSQLNTLKRKRDKFKGSKVFWEKSFVRLNARQLSKQLSKRSGLRVNVKLVNVFNYISCKPKAHLETDFYFNKKYSYYGKRFTSFYDILSALYIMSLVPKTEKLLINMLQYSMSNMHKKGFRPKHFFYFLGAIITNMPKLKEVFKAFRLVVTGKLSGGTGRTKTMSVGFGELPRQTLKSNLRYAFGDLHSKYGAYGLRLFTWKATKLNTTGRLRNRLLQSEKLYALAEKEKPSYLKLSKKLFKNNRQDLSSKVSRALKIRSIENVYGSWIKNKVFAQARETDHRISKDQAISIFVTPRRIIRKKLIPVSALNYKELIIQRKIKRVASCDINSKSLLNNFVFSTKFKSALFKNKTLWHSSDAQSKAIRKKKKTLFSVIISKYKYGVKGRPRKMKHLPKNKEMLVAFRKRNKVWIRKTFLKKYAIRKKSKKSIRSKENESLNSAKTSLKFLNKELNKRRYRNHPAFSGLPANAVLGKLKRVLKKKISLKHKLFLANTKKVFSVSKRLQDKWSLIKQIFIRSWAGPRLSAGLHKTSRLRLTSLSNIGLRNFVSLLNKKAYLQRSINSALVPKMFKRSSRLAHHYLKTDLEKSKYSTVGFYSIKKKQEWFNLLQRWKQKNTKRTESVLNNTLFIKEKRLRNKAFFARERLLSRNRFQSLSFSARAESLGSTKFKNRNNRDTVVPVAKNAIKRIQKLANNTVAPSIIKLRNMRLKRRFWVKSFYEVADYKFTIPSSRAAYNTDLLAKKNAIPTFTKDSANWVKEFSSINNEIQHSKLPVKMAVNNKKILKHADRISLFNKGLLEETLGVPRPYVRANRYRG